MQLAAWDQGVISGLYTGFKEDRMRRDFAIPNELKPTVVVGFGYPTMKILGKKNRRPLSELAFVDKYGNKFDPKKLDRKSTRLNSSHRCSSYAAFCLKKT